MVQTVKNNFVLGLVACLATVVIAFSDAAQADDTRTIKLLQPQSLNHAGVYALRDADPNLTGAGVKFAVIARSLTYINGEPQNDYRPNIEHNAFKNAQLRFHDQGTLPAGISPHSTAICSILFGEDPNASNPDLMGAGEFHYEGTVPKAKAEVYEFWHFLSNNVFPNSPPDADILTVSMGTQLEDWWTRGIESMAEHTGLIVVASIGNGTNASDPPLYPAASANVIGVGVVDSINTENLAANLENFALAYPEHSSVGPTGSGRCKPDIVAPGNCLAADANDPDKYEPTGNWSSFATPIVSGTIGLLVQKAKDDPDLNQAVAPQGGNCVIRSLLLNSATKLPYWHKGRLNTDDDHTVPLDYIQGAGMINALGAYNHLIAGQNKPGNVKTTGWDNNLLQINETPQNIYKITLSEPNDKFITATVVWNKHYNNVYPFEPIPEKDTNLRLELWAVDPNNHDNDYLLDYSDSSIDNVEHIYTGADANYTDYEIVVSYSDIDSQVQTTSPQIYGLAWNVDEPQESDNIFWYDLNADGIVNESDVNILMNNLLRSLQTSESYLFGDINTSGVIDFNDVAILLKHTNLEADWYTKPQEDTSE